MILQLFTFCREIFTVTERNPDGNLQRDVTESMWSYETGWNRRLEKKRTVRGSVMSTVHSVLLE
jgi:hypothetical protein